MDGLVPVLSWDQRHAACANCGHVGAHHLKRQDGHCAFIEEYSPAHDAKIKKCTYAGPEAKFHPNHDYGRGWAHDLNCPRRCKCDGYVTPKFLLETEAAQ